MPVCSYRAQNLSAVPAPRLEHAPENATIDWRTRGAPWPTRGSHDNGIVER